MAIVYAWPPVVATAKSWNLDSPLSRSYSMTSGKRYASAILRPRRRVKVTVHGRRNNGRGHMAALERLLRGGLNFVRLSSCRMAFGLSGMPIELAKAIPIEWREETNKKFEWETPPVDFLWFDGISWDAVPRAGRHVLDISSPQLPPGQIIALPGEFITVYTALNPQGEIHMVQNTARSTRADTPSVAIRLVTPVSGPGRVDFNTSETGIFELIGEFPDLGQSGGEVSDISLEFREIFPEEVAEGVEEQGAFIWT